MPEPLKLTLWNVQWAKAERGRIIVEQLFQNDPDVLCVTEGYPDMLKDSGHLISSDADHGYNTTDDRRKVMLWSKNPWSSVDRGEDFDFPSGRRHRRSYRAPSSLSRKGALTPLEEGRDLGRRN